MKKRILSLALVVALLLFPITVQGASKKTVKSLELAKTSIIAQVNDYEETEAYVKAKGTASTAITATCSDESVCTVVLEEDEEEPGLTYVGINAGSKPGEAVVTVQTVAKGKKGKRLKAKLKVTVVSELPEDEWE